MRPVTTSAASVCCATWPVAAWWCGRRRPWMVRTAPRGAQAALAAPCRRHGGRSLRARGPGCWRRWSANIARLLRAGCADDGTPFLALEWVDGQPLLAWCDATALAGGTAAAVRAGAGRRGLCARAPGAATSNRRTSWSTDKDNEAARLRHRQADVGRRPVDATELTRRRPRGDASHAAPEQVRGQTLTPATDVYALGVLLFELLSGQRPYRTHFDSVAQLEQAIDEAATSVGWANWTARCAATSTPSWRKPCSATRCNPSLTRSLMTTCAAIARPAVLARPDTVAYSVGRFVRRHRALSLGAAGVPAVAGPGTGGHAVARRGAPSRTMTWRWPPRAALATTVRVRPAGRRGTDRAATEQPS